MAPSLARAPLSTQVHTAACGQAMADCLKRGRLCLVIALELFNREYWKQDPLQVAQTGLRKMQAVAQQAESA